MNTKPKSPVFTRKNRAFEHIKYSENSRQFFFHPDYTVGCGITPHQLALADYTAGGELHPAPKIFIFIFYIIHVATKICK
jgi:hypothetical protein